MQKIKHNAYWIMMIIVLFVTGLSFVSFFQSQGKVLVSSVSAEEEKDESSKDKEDNQEDESDNDRDEKKMRMRRIKKKMLKMKVVGKVKKRIFALEKPPTPNLNLLK